jgi:hypothetical protein
MASLWLLQIPTQSQAQDWSRKFGKITNYEIDMQRYQPDTAAVAVYLYENLDVSFLLLNQPGKLFQQMKDYSVKIKILKPEGFSLADVEIPYRTSSTSKEYVSQLSVSAYNRVDGKIVKTELKNSDARNEQLSETMYVRKFTIPEVRVGTIIEYKYRLTSDYYFDIAPVRVQHAYPVVYHRSEVRTPQYFLFNINAQGHHRVAVQTSREVHPGTNFNDDVRTIVAENVPALVDEPYVWSVNDFRTKVSFELRSIEIPGTYYKNYTTSWEAIDKVLKDSSFGEHLRGGTPLRDEVDAIKASTGGDEPATLYKILKLVTGRMNWNGRYNLLATNPRQRLNEGAGGSAEINAILHGAIRHAGFNVTPVLLNPRQAGRLPYGHPSIESIDTFVLLVTLSDGTRYVLDGTRPTNLPNVIPVDLKVDRARVYGAEGDDGWIDLTQLPGDERTVMTMCEISADGTLTGKTTQSMRHTAATGVKLNWADAGSEDKYVEEIEKARGIEVTSFTIDGLETAAVTEKTEYTMPVSSAGDFLYVNALVTPFMTTNRFSQQERRLPVEFNDREKHTVSAVITIPEGYAVEELPQNIRMTVCDNGASYLYQAVANGRVVQLKMDFSLNRLLFTVDEYDDLNTFFGMVAEKNNAQIVLKKI